MNALRNKTGMIYDANAFWKTPKGSWYLFFPAGHTLFQQQATRAPGAFGLDRDVSGFRYLLRLEFYLNSSKTERYTKSNGIKAKAKPFPLLKRKGNHGKPTEDGSARGSPVFPFCVTLPDDCDQ